jgi:membrane protein implicated in regulation of membrane protease activity
MVYAMLESRQRNWSRRGDLMNSKTRESREFSWMGWVVGGISLLLLLSAGLEFFVQQTLGHHSVASVILALYLAFWSDVLGLGILLFLAAWWIVEWRRVSIKRAAMNSEVSTGPRSQHLEEPELRVPQHDSTIGHGPCCS